MILKKIAKKLLDYDVVVRVEFLGTKVRAYLVEKYVLDVYYNQTLGKYSYTLIKDNRRVIGWDNASHHVKVETKPASLSRCRWISQTIQPFRRSSEGS